MMYTDAAPQKAARSQSTPRGDEIHIAEEVKISIDLCLERFRFSDQREMDFPSSFTGNERAYIHRMAQSLGYVSKSKGKGLNRFLTIWKRDGPDRALHLHLPVTQNSLCFIHNLLQMFPVRNKERKDMQPSTKRESSGEKFRPSGFLNNSVPLVPDKRNPSELDCFRRSLPVHECQEEIVRLIRANSVVLVVGETGSGKTTQIPQFLLDDCSMKGEACRIICTQPRRLAVIALAERVAAERGESVGQTVGYHIRLENRFSSKTVLTFCTAGVLLRTLMAGDTSLRTVTHVIVDEVHERDGLTDFLLIKMQLLLQTIPSLKVILSSAALDVDLFRQYFGSCPVIHLKGRQFEVKELFLEDVLRLTGFNRKSLRKHNDTQEKQQACWTEKCQAAGNSCGDEKQRSSGSTAQGDSATIKLEESESEQLEPWVVKEMDSCIASIFYHEDQDALDQLFNLILCENVTVDYAHSETGATPLMVTASRGLLAQMEQLLIMGADISVQAFNGWRALDFARSFQQTDAVDLLQSSIPLREASVLDELTLDQCGSAGPSTEDQELLQLYHHSFDDKWVDLDLILHLLHYICSTTSEGAVLIFLPGYDEIVTLRYNILYDDKRFSTHPESFQIFTLHSDMQTLDQRKVLDTSPAGVRKIILSTNIAETSITINDVVFVIDSGKVKEKSFDTLSHVSLLKTVWTSKASVLQRKGRAGRCRPGICFHLFSRLRFSNMLEFQVPQLLRMPLQGLCLQTKLLAPSSQSVADFLCRAPQPPPADAISNAVYRLKTIDAMDQDEELTYLGCYLADLSLEPHLGKMLLCSVVLKCLDPILTIVCTLAYRDPFILPAQGSKKRDALQCRKRFSSYSLSDHMALLRVFQAWQKACYDGSERSFCQKNFVSQSTMEMILGMRVQLLGQLRAIGFVRPRGGSDIRELNLNSENWAVVKAALLAGMYPNMAHVNQDTLQLSSDKESKVHFHPTSVLNQFRENSSDSSSTLPTDWLIYDEMCRGKRMATVRCCSMVTPITVAVFGGSAMLPNYALQESAAQRPGDSQQNDSDSGMEDIAEIRVDKWLAFQLEIEAAKNVNKLKQMWQNLFIKKIRFPAKSYTEREDTTLQTLVLVLTEGEKSAGLQQPSGIGQRPRPMIPGDWPRAPVTKSKCSSPQRPTDTSHHKMPADSGLPQTRVHSRAEASLSKGQLSDDLWTSCSLSSNSPSISTCTRTSGKLLSAAQPVRYFIMESSNIRNLEISQQDGMWSTTLSIKTNLSRAFLENNLVILIFTVQGTGCFQGFARMTSEISRESCLDWGFVGLEEVFGVEWIHKQILPFQCAKHILNPWNDNKVVYESSEGQELEPQAGRQLLLLWDRFFGNVDQEQLSTVRGPQYQ